MSAKEWRRRINHAYQAVQEGSTEKLVSLCEEIAAMESRAAEMEVQIDELTKPKAKVVEPPPATIPAYWKGPQ